jgi:hypothetical protein
MRGPVARKGTRWWIPAAGEHPVAPGTTVELKAVDPDYVVPGRLIDEAETALRPVALRVATDAAADTARRLGASGLDGFTVDEQQVGAAVGAAVSVIMGVARRHAEMIRAEILRADGSADSLDEVLTMIDSAYAKGGNWVLMAGRTLANALRNDAALQQARALGVTHTQWISRRDPRVRDTHRIADGQVRLVGDAFQVGAFRLRFPCDPTDLPDSWPEVAGCRCGLLLGKPSEDLVAAARQVRDSLRAPPGAVDPAARRLLSAAAATPDIPVPSGANLPGPAHRIVVPEPVVGYRLLGGGPGASVGQWITLPGVIVLALIAAAGVSDAAQLAVWIPAGTVVTVANGAVILDEGATLEVISVTGQATATRVVT